MEFVSSASVDSFRRFYKRTVLNTSMQDVTVDRCLNLGSGNFLVVSLKPRGISLPQRNLGYSGGETNRYSIVISSKTIDSG